MTTARTGHTTTVLGGWICGQAAPPAACGKVLVAGGRIPASGDSVVTNSAELYDPAEGTWTALPPMSVARAGHTASILFSGTGTGYNQLTSLLIVAGGETDTGVPTPTVEAYDIAEGVWKILEPMSTGRVGHSMTMLPANGKSKFFVAGGIGEEGLPLRSVESFDPNAVYGYPAGAWTVQPDMALPRTGHTGTAVPGPNCHEPPTDWGTCNLLIVGGSPSPEGAASTEVLLRHPAKEDRAADDPDRTPAHWAAGPALSVGRVAEHTASVLGGRLCPGGSEPAETRESWCGSVLITGGRDSSGSSVGAVEVYSPGSPELGFQPTSETGPRAGHQAISLEDGRLLLVGGTGNGNEAAVGTALYDPTRPIAPWSAGTALSTARAVGHTATALFTSNGEPMQRVLVVGGRSGVADDPLAAAEVLYVQTAARTWVRGPAMGIARADHTATALPGNRVLVAGGAVDARAEIFTHDPATEGGDWTFTGQQLEARAGHTATLLSINKVLVAGGARAIDGRLALATTELYDIATGQWAAGSALNHARVNHTATRLADGRVLVVGGSVPLPDPQLPGPVEDNVPPSPLPPPPDQPPVEVYDPLSNSWTAMAVPPDFAGRWGHTATTLKDGRLLVVGGRPGDPTATTPAAPLRESWIFDPMAPVTSRWARVTDTIASHADHTATLLDGPECQVPPAMTHCGKVLVAGGTGSQMELFDPQTRTWAPAGSLSMLSATATALPSGLVLLAGGDRNTSLYDPGRALNPWSSGGKHLDQARRNHTATLIPGGKLLLAGGSRVVRDRQEATPNTEMYDGVSTPLDPPGNLTASALADDSFGVRLRWTAPTPARSGGAEIIGYRAAYVEHSAKGTIARLGPTVFLHSGDQLGTDLRGLPAKDPLTLQVAAFNEAGMGPWGRVDFVREAAVYLPLAPTDVHATPGNRSAIVEWSPPPDNGTVVVGYRITTQRPPNVTGDVPASRDVPATPTTATVSGLDIGDRYSFSVQALSSPTAAGPAANSNTVLIGTPTGKPRVTSATARSRSALVRWQPPPDPGGGPITSYDITAEPGGATTTVGGGTETAVVTGLTNGVEYRFQVRAANRYGPSVEISDLSDAATTPMLGPPALLVGVAAPEPAVEAPTLDGLYPRGGPVNGGGEVVLSGAGFGGATEVRFGDAPPVQFKIVSPHQIVAVAPRFKAVGTVRVTVTGPEGTSAVKPESLENIYYYGSGGWESHGYPLGAPNAVGSATALSNGKLLVVGPGKDPATSIVLARLYDPQTGEWTPTAAPTKVPTAAIALEDGRVLTFTRGAVKCVKPTDTTASNSYVNNAVDICTDPDAVTQLFDPAAANGKGGWILLGAGGAKETAANGAVAEIAGGKILVSGGCCNTRTGFYTDSPVTASEIFDPAENTWTATTGRPAHARNGHTLTTLSGPNCGQQCGAVLAVGGFRRPMVLGPSYGDPEPLIVPPELFDPRTETWRAAPAMSVNRYGHTSTLLPNGKVLVAGGSTVRLRDAGTEPINASATAEIYDPAVGTWTTAPAMPRVRYNHTATLLADGRVLMAGGVSPAGPVNVADIYDPATNKWVPAGAEHVPGARTAVPVGSTGACGVNCGKVMLLGTTGDVEMYSPPPVITTVSPTSTLAGDQPIVTIMGRGLANDGEVMIGGVAAEIMERSDTVMKVRPSSAPRLSTAPLAVTTTGGEATSADPFMFLGSPGAVKNLTATVQGTRAVRLRFGAAGSVGDADPPAQFYVLKQSRQPITESNFDQARSLCEETGGVCSYEIAHAGDALNVDVAALRPETTYHWAVRARVGEAMGPLATVSATTASLVLSPGRVTDLVSTAVSASEVRLTFSAPGSPDAGSPPASSYVIKQSKTPILDLASFESGRSLCDGVCGFSPQKVGDELSLSVTGLAPSTTYHYAIRVQHADGTLGELSNLSSATTSVPCAPVAGAGNNQVSYAPGYHLVSVPSGTRLPTPVLYGWFNQGSGRYSFHDPSTVESGRGYWAWFACPQLVELATGGASSASAPLSAYRASMVGNPSANAPAILSGHDFAATWDQSANGGVGAYSLSGFREKVALGVGQAAWAFSYKDTTLSVSSG